MAFFSRNAAKAEARASFRNEWATPLSCTLCAAPAYFLFTVCCPPCAAYQQRSRILFGNLNQYTCCGGTMACSGQCGESQCPALCLALEVMCCFSLAVVTNRIMLQDSLQIHNSPCDNCILGFLAYISYLNCVCQILVCLTDIEELNEAAFVVESVAHMAYCVICSCVQTQQYVELNRRDGGGPGTQTRAPRAQKMTR
jgi:hypothetical protein